jgi:hypothetical protein
MKVRFATSAWPQDPGNASVPFTFSTSAKKLRDLSRSLFNVKSTSLSATFGVSPKLPEGTMRLSN